MAAQPVANPFLTTLGELGFEGLEDETVARDRLVEAYRQQQQRQAEIEEQYRQAQQYAAWGQQYYQLAQDPEFRQFMESRQGGGSAVQGGAGQSRQPVQASRQTSFGQVADQDQSKSWWAPPVVDERLVSQYRTQRVGADGEIIEEWKSDAPLALRQQYENLELYRRDWADKLVRDPQRALEPAIEHVASRLVRQVIQDEFSRREVEQAQRAVQMEISTENPWLFQTDARTGQVARNAAGAPVLSAAGQRAYEIYNEVEAMGISDPRKAWQMTRAMALTEFPEVAAVALGFQQQSASGNPLAAAAGGVGQQVQQAAQQPATVADRQRAYAKRNSLPPNSAANRDASQQPGANGASTRRLSFGDSVMAGLAAAGIPMN